MGLNCREPLECGVLFVAVQHKYRVWRHVFAILALTATWGAEWAVVALWGSFARDRDMTHMARAIFPAPDHDHDRCTSSAIAHAETLCAARAQRLTPIRRQVLEALLASHKPLGAYA